MDPVSNVDRIVLILQQRLRDRTRAVAHSTTNQPASKPPADALASVQALAAVEGVDEGQLRRALIQNVLADQFGAELINDAKFQQVVEGVTQTINADGQASELLGRAIHELRASAR